MSSDPKFVRYHYTYMAQDTDDPRKMGYGSGIIESNANLSLRDDYMALMHQIRDGVIQGEGFDDEKTNFVLTSLNRI